MPGLQTVNHLLSVETALEPVLVEVHTPHKAKGKVPSMMEAYFQTFHLKMCVEHGDLFI